MRIIVPRYEDAKVLGLPESGKVCVITNSQRSRLACPKRWWFDQAEGLKTRGVAAPLRYGRGWDLYLEDVNAWWMEHDTDYPGDGTSCVWCGGEGALKADGWDDEDCEECEGTGDGPVNRIATEWLQYYGDLNNQARSQGWDLWVDSDDLEKQIETLNRAAYGYLQKYGPQPPQNVRIVGVKMAIAAPIRVPGSGRPYRPEMWVIEDQDGGLRLPRTGEALQPPQGTTLRKVKWPWYQVGELDRLAASRKTGALWVGEFKSSQSPAAYLKGQEVDPQVTGYTWMLQQIVSAGLLSGEGNRTCRGGIDPETPIAGFTYDCASSGRQHDPVFLKAKNKAGQLSVAMNRTVPTWRFIDFCAEHGVDQGPYSDHIVNLGKFDRKLYVRDWGSIGPMDRNRYGVELYGIAKKHAQGFRDAATATPEQVEWRFPRVAICRLPGGSCPYTAPCLEDGEGTREPYEIKEPIRWDPEESPNV